jgi:hypothetical protein
MGGINHVHYNVLNMMTLGFKVNVQDLNGLGGGGSASVDLKPIETELEAAERGGVYLYATSLNNARVEVNGKLPGSQIQLPLPSGALLPVFVRRESDGQTTFLAAGDPADRNWNFVYGDTSYAWHPTVPNRVVASHLGGNGGNSNGGNGNGGNGNDDGSCPALIANVKPRPDRSTANALGYEVTLGELQGCHTDLDLRATVGSNNVPLQLTRTADRQTILVPITTPSRFAEGQIRVSFSLGYKRSGSSTTASLTGASETVCNYRRIRVSADVRGNRLKVTFDRSQTNGHCFTVPFDLTVDGSARGQFVSNRTFSLLTGQTTTALAFLSPRLATARGTVRVMNGSAQEWPQAR